MFTNVQEHSFFIFVNVRSSISIKYSAVKITLSSYENLVSLFRNEGDTRYSPIARHLIHSVITEDKWSNAKTLYNKYPEELAACLGN